MSKLQEAWMRRRSTIIAMRAFGHKEFGNLTRRYMERSHFADPAVWWSTEKPGLAYVSSPKTSALRHIGNVVPETGRHWRWMSTEQGHLGWYTNDEGESWKDGSGLVWGVVYALSGRRGKTRYVAGYQFGGVDDGPVLDLSKIYEAVTCFGSQNDHDEARAVARVADEMARLAAEDEQEYRRREYADIVEEAV